MLDAEGLRRRDRAVTLGGLLAVTALSWAYLLWGATGAHGHVSHFPPAADAVLHAASGPDEEDPDILP